MRLNSSTWGLSEERSEPPPPLLPRWTTTLIETMDVAAKYYFSYCLGHYCYVMYRSFFLLAKVLIRTNLQSEEQKSIESQVVDHRFHFQFNLYYITNFTKIHYMSNKYYRLVLLVCLPRRLEMTLPRTPRTGRDWRSPSSSGSRTDKPRWVWSSINGSSSWPFGKILSRFVWNVTNAEKGLEKLKVNFGLG